MALFSEYSPESEGSTAVYCPLGAAIPGIQAALPSLWVPSMPWRMNMGVADLSENQAVPHSSSHRLGLIERPLSRQAGPSYRERSWTLHICA